MGEERLPKLVLSWTSEDGHCRGRPKVTWRKTFKKDMQTNEQTDEDIESVAVN